MKKLIEKIKKIFQNLMKKNNIKELEYAKEKNTINKEQKEFIEQKQVRENKENYKKEFFELYEKIKSNQYDLKKLTQSQSNQIIAILDSEIAIKKAKLEHNITELNILKIENNYKID